SVFMKPAFQYDTWTVLAVQSRRDSLGPARSFKNTFLLVVLLTIFVVIFVSSVLIRRNLVPLAILREGAGRLSRGDFNSRVEISSGDEFEDLAVSFNDMSQQIGKQFTRLSEMGKLVQSILEAHDRGKIVDLVMSSFRHSVHCEWLGISLTDSDNPFHVITFYNNASAGVPAGTRQFKTVLSREEFETIRATTGILHVTGADRFTTLLAPMAAEGGGEFYLFPVSIKDRFLGLLILGYRLAPEQVREELARAGQIADELANALDNVRLIDELNCLNLGIIKTLANAVDAKSPWTAGHSERVTMLALEIGKEMGVSERELDLLHWGGLFHDMGKIGVPEEILDKPGKLTEEEFALIKKHPGKGAEILAPIRAYNGAIPIVAQHHERFDGEGYPLGLSGEEIYLGARILAVADVFDALYSDRPYRQGWEIGKVIAYLEENAGRNFDPVVVKAFMRIDRTAYFESHADTDLSISG
ncbi:MAG TPA: HD domain-containing phosphohydrolase, partial [Geobacteraceae bacterium]|nr:HD domain-containing phosphohydrolase [Geobacteraceae bacterium]